MKRCPECAEKVQNGARVCKHCNYRFSDEDLESESAAGKKRTIWTGVVIVAALFVMVKACSSQNNEPASSTYSSSTSANLPTLPAPAERASIKVKPWSWGMSDSGRYCEGGGTIVNTGDVSLLSLKLQIHFFDSKKNLVATDTAYSSVTEIPQGGRSTFKVFTSCPSNVDTATIEVATHGFGSAVSVSE